MKDQVVVRAPVRVDFAGGPSDVAPFCTEEWGYVVNAAIDKYAVVRVARRTDGQVVLGSADLGIQETYPSVAALRHDTPLRLLTTAVELTGIRQGVEVQVQTDVPAGAGLGVSAAVSVALLYALHEISGEGVPAGADLAQAAIRHETGKLHNVGGGQDQYAATFGAVQSYRFAGGEVGRRYLAVAPETIQALDESLLLCYSGTSRISGGVLDGVMRRYVAGDAAVTGHLRRLREIAAEIETMLEAGDIAGLGPHMTAAWHAFRALHPSVSTPRIEQVMAVAAAHGATGGKATGAGGGGCVLLACAPGTRDAVTAALHEAGFTTIPFHITRQGVHIVTERPSDQE